MRLGELIPAPKSTIHSDQLDNAADGPDHRYLPYLNPQGAGDCNVVAIGFNDSTSKQQQPGRHA